MAESKRTPDKNTVYTKSYERMRGICSASTPESRGQFRLLENMYTDYRDGAGAIESIPGFRKLLSLGKRINGIFLQKLSEDRRYFIIHSGDGIYRIAADGSYSLESNVPIAEIEDTKSTAFSVGDCIYIMDGKNILCIESGGGVCFVGSESKLPYVPTLYYNGEKCEERNLMYNMAEESFCYDDVRKHIYGSPSIKYAVTSESERTCTVVKGFNNTGELHIPAYAKIGDNYYRVTSISSAAFKGNPMITSLHTNAGLLTIGASAFSDCIKLRRVSIAHTVTEIQTECFYGCSDLVALTLNNFPISIGTSAFSGCNKNLYVKCAGDIKDFGNLTANTGLESITPISISVSAKIQLSFTLRGPISGAPTVVAARGYEVFEYDETEKTLKIQFADETDAFNNEVTVTYSTVPNLSSETDNVFLNSLEGRAENITKAIYGCKICESFDGRIFLSGNPSFPGTVFYSERDKNGTVQPFYFSSQSNFTDGVSSDSITDLLSTGGKLAVFKSGDDGSGTVFYHEPKKDGGKTVYPVSYIHGSVPVFGGAVNFFDEPVFLTSRGVCALEKVKGSDYREVRCRSENISSLLYTEDLSSASVTEWLEYLVVATGEHLYLADSRDKYTENGVLQYEWYRLTGIGTYKNDRRVYRYCSVQKEGYELSDAPDTKVHGTVMSESVGEETVFFEEKDGKRLLVYPTAEYEGGDFDPCCTVFGFGELLFFGTVGGDICIFNNDKRGVPPEGLALSDDFSLEEYKREMGGKIHPSYYSFASHRAIYSVMTASDDCGLPHLSKNTVRNSLVIKFKCFEGSSVDIGVETDISEHFRTVRAPLSKMSFEGTDFSVLSSNLSDRCNIRLPEYERGWTEKKILIRSSEFCSPFGVYSISYRYKINGNIKQ